MEKITPKTTEKTSGYYVQDTTMTPLRVLSYLILTKAMKAGIISSFLQRRKLRQGEGQHIITVSGRTDMDTLVCLLTSM